MVTGSPQCGQLQVAAGCGLAAGLGAGIATIRRRSPTLTDGHRPDIWQPGAMPLG
jgi:hypothetical protein